VRLPFQSKRTGQNGTITEICGIRFFKKILLPALQEWQKRTGYIGQYESRTIFFIRSRSFLSHSRSFLSHSSVISWSFLSHSQSFLGHCSVITCQILEMCISQYYLISFMLCKYRWVLFHLFISHLHMKNHCSKEEDRNSRKINLACACIKVLYSK